MNKMKSTEMIHKMTENMHQDDRVRFMAELKLLRFTIAGEVIGAMRNSNKMITLMYGK